MNYNELFVKSKEIASKSGLTQLELYQRFMFERILERISVSEYQDNFILKGGFFLYCLTNFDSRVTYDIDFLLSKIPNDEEKLKEILIEIISTQSDNDFISFEIRKISKINLQMKYHGLSVSLVGKIKILKHLLILILVLVISFFQV